jgi:molybdopterin synthase sulfur carrier subunit
MINILYFARLSESLGIKSEKMELPDDCKSVDDLLVQLRKRGEPFETAFSMETSVLFAINQEMSDRKATICDGDEIAFFPPVTGG